MKNAGAETVISLFLMEVWRIADGWTDGLTERPNNRPSYAPLSISIEVTLFCVETLRID